MIDGEQRAAALSSEDPHVAPFASAPRSLGLQTDGTRGAAIGLDQSNAGPAGLCAILLVGVNCVSAFVARAAHTIGLVKRHQAGKPRRVRLLR
jgi:hypothetical protein